MNVFEHRVREQFPGLYITFASIMIGLVLADAASVARVRLATWPPDGQTPWSGSARPWGAPFKV